MSLRREEAELRRALELSTQQVHELARLPPHSLSSSSTSHSRDLELRPVHPSNYNTPHHTPQGDMQFPILSPSPPADHALAQELGLTPSQPPVDLTYYPLETPASRINTFSSEATHDTPASVINTFPRTLQSPPTEPVATRVEVVLPRREMRHSSVDPIDSLRSGSPPPPPPPDNRVLVDASRSSGPSTSGPNTSVPGSSAAEAGEAGRRSARQRDNKEREEEANRKEAAAREERKRKRAEEQARLKAQEAELRGDEDYQPGRPEKKKRAERKKTSQTKSSQQKSSQAKSDTRSSQKSVASTQEKTPSVSAKALPDLPSVAEEPASSNASTASKSSKASAKAPPKAKSQPKSQRSAKQKATPEDPPVEAAEPSVEQPAASSADAPPSSSPSEPPESPVKTSAPPPKSPIEAAAPTTTAQPTTPAPRTPLQPARSTPGSAGGTLTPVKFKTARNDLSSVLAKFPGAKRTGMSRRTRIVPLHTTIGPGVKALPPPPPKTRKKVESEEEDSDTEGKVKVGSREWLMMED